MLVTVYNLLIISTELAKMIKINKIDEYYDQIKQKKYDKILKNERIL